MRILTACRIFVSNPPATSPKSAGAMMFTYVRTYVRRYVDADDVGLLPFFPQWRRQKVCSRRVHALNPVPGQRCRGRGRGRSRGRSRGLRRGRSHMPARWWRRYTTGPGSPQIRRFMALHFVHVDIAPHADRYSVRTSRSHGTESPHGASGSQHLATRAR